MADSTKQPTMNPTVKGDSKPGPKAQPSMNPMSEGNSPFFSDAARKAYKGPKK